MGRMSILVGSSFQALYSSSSSSSSSESLWVPGGEDEGESLTTDVVVFTRGSDDDPMEASSSPQDTRVAVLVACGRCGGLAEEDAGVLAVEARSGSHDLVSGSSWS